MDDIIRPRRPDVPEPTGHVSIPVTRIDTPDVDAAGITPRQPAPAAASVHIPEPTTQPEPAAHADPVVTFPEPATPQAPAAPQVAPTPVVVPAAQPESTLNLPATESDGSTNNLGDSLQTSDTPDNVPSPSSVPSPSLLAEIEAEEARQNEAKVTQAPQASSRHKGRWPAIIIAIIMALGLIAGAGYAYWQNNKTKPAPVAEKTDVVKEDVKNPATAEDIDKAVTDMDASIKKIDETKEFQESDLSDTTLGL